MSKNEIYKEISHIYLHKAKNSHFKSLVKMRVLQVEMSAQYIAKGHEIQLPQTKKPWSYSCNGLLINYEN